jgi:hypothetical protein
MEQHTIELIGTVLVALITALFGPMAVEYVKLKTTKKEEVIEVDPVKKELEQSCVIVEEIESIRQHLNADRVWITIIHNGGHFLHTNKSIQKFSVMHEVARPGVSSIGMIFKNIPISLFSKSVQQQIEGKIINIPDVNDPTISTFGLKSAFESVGTIAAVSKGLIDISTESLIGTIGVDYLQPHKLTEEELNYFTIKADRMSGYISTFIKDI